MTNVADDAAQVDPRAAGQQLVEGADLVLPDRSPRQKRQAAADPGLNPSSTLKTFL